MSFSCPHFCPDEDHCLRLKTDCVPGRPACVLGDKAAFAVPVEERLREKAEEKRALDNAGIMSDLRVARAGSGDQLHHERRGDERIEMQLESVKEPAEPRGGAGLPLLRRNFAEVRGLAGGGRRDHGVATVRHAMRRRSSQMATHRRFAHAVCRGQVTRWSLTIPLACMNA